MSFQKSIFLIVLLGLILTTLARSGQAATLQQVRNSGMLRVGIVLEPPWSLRNSDRELIGFEVDVARRLAAELEVEPRFVVYPFDELVTALETGEIDIIAAGLTITPERALRVNFSQPYATGGVSIATNLGSTRDIERLDDLNDSTRSVAALTGSVAAELAGRILPRATLRLFDSAADAATALIDGEVDAYLDDEPLPAFLALEHPGRIDVPVAPPLLETRAGFAVAKGDPDFLAYLNAWITAHEADTWLPTTQNYWFNSLRWREE
jgi:polar amino acid transport system substrate-binding protein